MAVSPTQTWYIQEITLRARITELAAQHGGIRPAARALRIDHGYLSRLANGIKKEPSAATLKKLGLARVVAYTRHHGDHGERK